MKSRKLKMDFAIRFKRFARKGYAAFNSMHRVVNTGVVAGSMLTFAGVTETAAQNTVATIRDSIPEQALDEVVVTGTKSELPVNTAVRPSTVISHVEIERQPAVSVADILKTVAGIDVRQRGPNGVLSGIAVRGGVFEQTAILLNGANITNPQTGHYNLSLPVSLADVERIEIIQGPSSLLYGAGAFSGGVNIITKKPDAANLLLEAKGGMYGLAEASARQTLKLSNSTHSLSAGYAASSGYIDNSAYQQLNVFQQNNFSVGNRISLDVQWGINDKQYGANTFFSAAYPEQYDETRALFAAVKATAGTRLKLTPQLYWNHHYDHYQLTRNRQAGENFHETDVAGLNLAASLAWEAGTTGAGVEIRNESIVSSNLGRDSVAGRAPYMLTDSRTNYALFLEHSVVWRGLTASVGLLANYNTAFPDAAGVYPSLNAALQLSPNWKIFASWNNAVRTPTFTDLYYKGRTHRGNSDVLPEQSSAFEAGLRYAHKAFSASGQVFYMRGENLIDWVKPHPDSLWESRNLTDLDKTGVEVSLDFRPGLLWSGMSGTSLHAGYAYMQQTKEASGLISNYVMDYLRHKLTVGLTHPVGRNVFAEWQLRWQDRAGSYTEYPQGSAEGVEKAYKPFSVLDVKLRWRVGRVDVFLSVNNVFDTYYFDIGNVPQAGVWALAGARMQL
jgi:iron complex outermembrane receptor protein